MSVLKRGKPEVIRKSKLASSLTIILKTKVQMKLRRLGSQETIHKASNLLRASQKSNLEGPKWTKIWVRIRSRVRTWNNLSSLSQCCSPNRRTKSPKLLTVVALIKPNLATKSTLTRIPIQMSLTLSGGSLRPTRNSISVTLSRVRLLRGSNNCLSITLITQTRTFTWEVALGLLALKLVKTKASILAAWEQLQLYQLSQQQAILETQQKLPLTATRISKIAAPWCNRKVRKATDLAQERSRQQFRWEAKRKVCKSWPKVDSHSQMWSNSQR